MDSIGIIRLSGRVAANIEIFWILGFVHSLSLYGTAVYEQKDFSHLYKKVAPSAVRINVLDTEGKLKSGTGIFLSEKMDL